MSGHPATATAEVDRRAAEYSMRAGYRLERRSGAGPSIPVLVLHGLGGARDQLWPWFAGAPRTVLAPDQRGHGDWAEPLTSSELSFDQLARDQLRLLDRLDIATVLVAGVSMGAGVAAAMARLAPNRVARLLLIRPAWLDRPFPPNLQMLVGVGELLDRFTGAELVAAVTESEEFRALAAASPAAAASVRAQVTQPGARSRSLRLRRLPGSVPFARLTDLSSITVATTVIGALGDPLHPVELARAWADALPAAQYHCVPSRDHHPQEYERELRELCARFAAEPDHG